MIKVEISQWDVICPPGNTGDAFRREKILREMISIGGQECRSEVRILAWSCWRDDGDTSRSASRIECGS